MENSKAIDSEMWRAIEEAKPIHLQLLKGEITKFEYERQRDAIIEKHLGKTEERVEQEWFP